MSFGQISPLKKGVGEKDANLKSFFYIRERERERDSGESAEQRG
jgi:hypothetical protein